MKFMKIAVASVAISAVAAGCRYSDGADGNGTAAGKDANTAVEIGTDGNGANIEEGSLDQLADNEGKFEDLYTKCTDVDFKPVYFGFDSTVVPQGEFGKIDAVASHLAENADRVVVIEGNCDDRGSNEYNMSLGENRAIIVRNYLVQNGIDAARIQTRSYGEERPAAQGNDESAWSKNRRDEFVIFRK